MKTIATVRDEVERRLQRLWLDELAGTAPDAWPHTFTLGLPSGAALEADFVDQRRQAQVWGEWSRTTGRALVEVTKMVRHTRQVLPTHLVVNDVDDAAAIAGPQWRAKLARGRLRFADLSSEFGAAAAELVAGRVVDWDETEFALLCTAGRWFTQHDATGLTPRQVPVEGLHAKWLNSHTALVCRLAGKDTLGLAARHEQRMHFTYLDPQHRRAGRRRHDSATVADTFEPTYRPRTVIISENKDTAIHFLPVADAVSIEGDGYATAVVAKFGWVRDAEHVVYWGDMDAYGLKILDHLRSTGLTVSSLLMNVDAYRTYCRFGTDVDVKGRLLEPGGPALTRLTADEQELYEHLIAPDWTDFRRVEQERVPLSVARDELAKLTGIAG